MYYKIISSGSKGNCVVINDVMVDVGVPFNKIKDDLYEIKYLLITHIHSDHVRPATLKSIKTMFPKIQIIGNYEVHQAFGVDVIANAGFEIVTDDYMFNPFECVHDVLCYGFTWTFGELDIIYATDTSSLKHAPKGKYDYLFIESNHSEKKLEMAMGQVKGGYNPYLGGKRHLSTEAAKNFYYLNRKSRDSEFIELHRSERFY
jgi:L-ascorbate metabolism protein UlaG (beta-lactamase superfamily)